MFQKLRETATHYNRQCKLGVTVEVMMEVMMVVMEVMMVVVVVMVMATMFYLLCSGQRQGPGVRPEL